MAFLKNMLVESLIFFNQRTSRGVAGAASSRSIIVPFRTSLVSSAWNESSHADSYLLTVIIDSVSQFLQAKHPVRNPSM